MKNNNEIMELKKTIAKLEATVSVYEINETNYKRRLSELRDVETIKKENEKLSSKLEDVMMQYRELERTLEYERKVHKQYIDSVREISDYQKYMIKQKLNNKAHYNEELNCMEVYKLRRSGVAFKDIADRLNASESTIRRRFKEALNIKKEMEEKFADEIRQAKEEAKERMTFEDDQTKIDKDTIHKITEEMKVSNIGHIKSSIVQLMEAIESKLFYNGEFKDRDRLIDEFAKVNSKYENIAGSAEKYMNEQIENYNCISLEYILDLEDKYNNIKDKLNSLLDRLAFLDN